MLCRGCSSGRVELDHSLANGQTFPIARDTKRFGVKTGDTDQPIRSSANLENTDLNLTQQKNP